MHVDYKMAIKADDEYSRAEELRKGWRQKYDRDAESVGGAPRVEPGAKLSCPVEELDY